MDYQSGIVSQLPDGDRLVQRVGVALDSARGHGAHVGWVRVAFTDAELDAIPETSIFAPMVAGDRRATLHADAPQTQIHAPLAPLANDIVVRKTRVGAFTTTDLGEQLRARGVDTLVLAGISTSGVVLSTVREAMDRDYRLVVLEDACADRDAETHAFLMAKVFAGRAVVSTVQGLLASWG
jgi:nicotinamidase-related amidase